MDLKLITFYVFLILIFPTPKQTYNHISTNFTANFSIKTNYYGTIFTINEPIARIVKDIVGDLFDVKHILPPGVDPHSFQLTPELINQLKTSKLILLIDPNNFGLDERILNMDSLKDIPKLTVDNYSDYGWTYLYVDEFGLDYHGAWLSPRNGLAIAKALAETLIKSFPEIQAVLESNLSAFEKEIKELVQSLNGFAESFNVKEFKGIAIIPPLAYIANWTGMNSVTTVLFELDEELSLSRYNKIVNDIKKRGKCIILAPKGYQKTRVGDLAKQLSEETGMPLVFVPVFSTFGASSYVDFVRLSMYSVLGVVGVSYNPSSGGEKVSAYVYIAVASIAFLAILEAYVIYIYKRREWELAEVD